jgi:hypothetical protein
MQRPGQAVIYEIIPAARLEVHDTWNRARTTKRNVQGFGQPRGIRCVLLPGAVPSSTGCRLSGKPAGVQGSNNIHQTLKPQRFDLEVVGTQLLGSLNI